MSGHPCLSIGVQALIGAEGTWLCTEAPGADPSPAENPGPSREVGGGSDPVPHLWGLPRGPHFRKSSAPSPQPSRAPSRSSGLSDAPHVDGHTACVHRPRTDTRVGPPSGGCYGLRRRGRSWMRTCPSPFSVLRDPDLGARLPVTWGLRIWLLGDGHAAVHGGRPAAALNPAPSSGDNHRLRTRAGSIAARPWSQLPAPCPASSRWGQTTWR